MRPLLRLAAVLCWCSAAATPQIGIPVLMEPGPRLGPSDFRATLDGSAAGILAVKSPEDDLLLMVVLDMTQDLNQATLAKDALVGEIQELPPKTAVSVLRAQGSLKVLADPTTDRGTTGDAILAKSAVRVAIVYVTDSDIGNYRENFTNPTVNSSDTRDLSRKFPEALVQERISKLTTRLSRQQTPLFVVHLVYRSDTVNQAYQSGLKQLAETTAGAIVFCRSGADVPAAIQQVLQTVMGHYSLTLALPRRPGKSVQVQVAAAGANAPRVVSCRTHLLLRGK